MCFAGTLNKGGEKAITATLGTAALTECCVELATLVDPGRQKLII